MGSLTGCVAYRSPTASLQAIPQATGLALPPTIDQSDTSSPPNPQRALNIAVQAISSGINQAISTVQNSGQPGTSPVPAPAQAPAQSPGANSPGILANPAISNGLGTATTSAPQTSGGVNTGAIVGGEPPFPFSVFAGPFKSQFCLYCKVLTC